MKLYRVYSEDENRNKEIWQTENAKDISSIINMDFSPPSLLFTLFQENSFAWKLLNYPSWDPFQNVNVWWAILFERCYFYNF